MDSIIDFFIHIKQTEMELHKHRLENEIHVTELLECPLKRDFRNRYPFLVVPTIPLFMHGDLIHMGLQRVIEIYGKERGLLVEIEREIEKRFTVDGKEIILKGRCDAVLPNTVIEIKSSLSDMSLPYPHHEKQLRIYMNILSRKGMLIYITPTRATEYFYDDPLPDDEIIQMIRSSLSYERTPLFSWECERCSFSMFCPKKQSGKTDR
ncbi:MAG: hypothetical protein DSO07_04280 [Thermoproteota archaeon]|uniref:CRISPR-associated exonuclease Cas4 n=1 Tax=Candidatus Methanodesulfokora washburnensis TaxID=2478471 RepID=A0A429GX42_9CREN|nr:hypothetical protein [Candidatus Methanodesulfokores washburnensis]RSN78291.1 hypothetical protein D6D85_01390 [Candidatus Methanodesulfokores washburnensis]TDA41499.1 MAG: hypothetical protein DSO07_04280 [Candidatus Korarchaeota archaeon]